MSIFRNKTNQDLWLEDENGVRVSIKPDQVITKSNYFKRFTIEGNAEYPLLTLVEDDGIPYAKTTTPNYLRSWTLNIDDGTDWSDNLIDFTASDVFGTEALFLQMVVDDAAVEVMINDLPASVFTIDADSTQSFNTGELLVSKVAFKLPSITGGIPSIVRVLAATTL